MTPLEIVVRNEFVEVCLDLFDALEPGGASRYAEALVEHDLVQPFHEAVGAGKTNLGGAMLDSFHRGQQLVGVDLRMSAELAPVVGEDRPEWNPQRLVERKDPVIEQIARGDRHLRVVELSEGDGTEDVHDDLDIDLADALQSSQVEGILVQEFAGTGCLHVSASELGMWRSRS